MISTEYFMSLFHLSINLKLNPIIWEALLKKYPGINLKKNRPMGDDYLLENYVILIGDIEIEIPEKIKNYLQKIYVEELMKMLDNLIK
jgi:hypothetical protein